MSVKRTLPVSLCLLIALSASANEELFESAAKAASQGDLALMQQTYETILVAESGNVRALNGKATAQAWRGNYFAAIETYRRVARHRAGESGGAGRHRLRLRVVGRLLLRTGVFRPSSRPQAGDLRSAKRQRLCCAVVG